MSKEINADIEIKRHLKSSTNTNFTTCLKEVDLSNWLVWVADKITAQEAKGIAYCLQHSPSLVHLSLSGNSIGGSGSSALAEALLQNNSLTSLDISSNRIGEEGGRAIADALAHNSALRSLSISYNSIGDEGCVAIAAALRYNSSLTSLDIIDNDYSHATVKQFEDDIFKYNYTLTSLQIDHVTDKITKITNRNNNDNEQRKQEVLRNRLQLPPLSSSPSFFINTKLYNSTINRIPVESFLKSVLPVTATLLENQDNNVAEIAQSVGQFHDAILLLYESRSIINNTITTMSITNITSETFNNKQNNNDITSIQAKFNKLEIANTTLTNSAVQLVAKHEQFESTLTELRRLSHQLLSDNKNSGANMVDYIKLAGLTKQKNKLLQQICSEEAHFGHFNEIKEHITKLECSYQQFNDGLSYILLNHPNDMQKDNCTNYSADSSYNCSELYNTDFTKEYEVLKENFVELEKFKSKYKQNFVSKLEPIQTLTDNAVQSVRNALSNVGNRKINTFSFTSLEKELTNCYKQMTNEHKYLITELPTELDAILNDELTKAETSLIIKLSNFVNQYLDFFSSLKHSLTNFMAFVRQSKSHCLLNKVELEYYHKMRRNKIPRSTETYMFDINDYFPISPKAKHN